jgi:hypothetical protein
MPALRDCWTDGCSETRLSHRLQVRRLWSRLQYQPERTCSDPNRPIGSPRRNGRSGLAAAGGKPPPSTHATSAQADLGGYVAAWLAGIEIRWDGILHGLLTWGVATLLTVYLLSSTIGSASSGGASALGGAASAAGSTVTAAAQPIAQASGVTPDMLQQQAQAYLKPANPDPATMSSQDAQKR